MVVRLKYCTYTLAVLIAVTSMGQSNDQNLTPEMVTKLAEELLDFKIRENPNLGVKYGVEKYQDKVMEWNEGAFQRRIKKSKQFLKTVQDYLSNGINLRESKVTLKIMEHGLLKFLEGAAFRNYTKTLRLELSSLTTEVTVDTLEKLDHWFVKVKAYQDVVITYYD
ncbi:hypothetical protein EB796_001476 [Bugula neritina]|uniref:Uncharacterized protein n=1 Tax=Bugula neritina TaxID=10212 RepID=A0A7J7KQ33_BUGNE|nr:hypothetical protein EB796_001476 [Bugula neritina]